MNKSDGPDLDQLRELWIAGDSPDDISVATGIPRSSIYWHVKRLGLTPRTVRGTLDDQVAERWAAGESIDQIGSDLSIGRHAIRGAVKRQGPPQRRVRTLLTDEQHEEFVREWMTDADAPRIAKHFGIPLTAVHNRRRRNGLPTVAEVRARDE